VDTQATPLCLSHRSPDSSARRKAPVLLHACVVQIHWLVPALSVLLHAGASPTLSPPPHRCSAAGLPPHPLSTPPIIDLFRAQHRRSSTSSKHAPSVFLLLQARAASSRPPQCATSPIFLLRARRALDPPWRCSRTTRRSQTHLLFMEKKENTKKGRARRRPAFLRGALRMLLETNSVSVS
jgi:hypothetical protein